MSNVNSETIYKEISQLPTHEKIMLFSKLMAEISVSLNKDKNLNIYDIKGVGKEIWNGIDAQEYVNNERLSWE